MQDTQAMFTQMYSAFNRRDIDGVFAFMTEDVDWPRASEGGRVVGKAGIRAYWTRQWAEFDPNVEPIQVTQQGAGQVALKVHQFVMSLAGEVLFDGVLWHVYTLADGFVARMDIHDDDPAA